MAKFLTEALHQVGQSGKSDDDLVDRLNHRVTVVLLVTFTGFVSANQFIGEPISCWTPSHFSGPQIAYTNSICWLKGTYYLEIDRSIIPHRTENSQFRVAYYQYVPYMLLAMAFLFYLPQMFWRYLSQHFGYDLRWMIRKLKGVMQTGESSELDEIARHLHVTLQYHQFKTFHGGKGTIHRLLDLCRRGHRSPYWLTLCYIVVKILYLVNCFSQFYFLSLFLSFSFHTYGLQWWSNFLRKLNARTIMENYDSPWFPRVVMCDFMVRHLGSNQHWMAIQCNLPINLFNEIIFLMLWVWLHFLTAVTCVSIVFYFLSITFHFDRNTIRKYLHMSLPSLPSEEQDQFLINYLQPDGILVLRILAQNTNDVIMGKLVGALLKMHARPVLSMNQNS